MRFRIFVRAAAAGLLLSVSVQAGPSIFDADAPSAPAAKKTADSAPAPPQTPTAASDAPQSGQPANKAPIPDAAAQKQANANFEQVYADDIAKAKTPEQKRLIAKRILESNPAGSDDPATRYVLLCRMRDLAADAGDATDAMAAADELEHSYAIDGMTMRAELLARISKTARNPADFKLLFRSALQQLDRAIEGDQYVHALRFAELAEGLARRTGDASLVTTAMARAREEREAAAAFGASKRALEELAKNPASPDANLRVGRFYCFFKGDWARGLAMLAKSGDRVLAPLAKREAQPASAPASPLDLADGWAELMSKETPGVAVFFGRGGGVMMFRQYFTSGGRVWTRKSSNGS